MYGQAYFVYDSKKSGAMTTSHLRFGKHPIQAPYLITSADFIACHHEPFLHKIDLLSLAAPHSIFLLNTATPKEKVWDSLPREVQDEILSKKIRLYAIDAVSVAEKTGMGRRINTIMQACFFAISGILPKEEAIEKIKASIRKTYLRKGEAIVAANLKAVDESLSHLYEVEIGSANSPLHREKGIPSFAPENIQKVTGVIIEGRGEELPVSAFEWTVDGTWPSATSQYEKRRIATEIPYWNPEFCIQCGKCVSVCPHAAIRAKVATPENLIKAPESFKTADYKAPDFKGNHFIIQVAPEDCTGCTLCSQACPMKAKGTLTMQPIEKRLQEEIQNFDFFMTVPDVDRSKLNPKMVKSVALMRPLFEFSGACAGCGETPYVKMMTQLFGDRLLIANATGCSSIYGGNLPTTPYAQDAQGRGPAWANSLFEDNAEFGLGMRTSVDSKVEFAIQLLTGLKEELGTDLVDALLTSPQESESQIAQQRLRVEYLKKKLSLMATEKAHLLLTHADYLVKKSVWILGGDGWAYDIGYGGLDHVLYSGKNVNILVMDTEVYSNTGGQRSKATPLGASAKFAVSGNSQPRKDLGLLAMASEAVYVATIALGANDAQALKAMNEAESFNGPSLILAYSHCIAHGYDVGREGLTHQQLAVKCGLWPLYRFDPRLKAEGKNPFQLDSPMPSIPVEDFMATETRFKFVKQQNPEHFKELAEKAQKRTDERWMLYQKLAKGE